MGPYTSIILLVGMVFVFYFLILRPQKKQRERQLEMVKTLEPGVRVFTSTGIYATIIAVGDKQIVLETAPGNRITMVKSAVARVVGEEEEDADLISYRGGAGTQPLPGAESESSLSEDQFAPESGDQDASDQDSDDQDSGDRGTASGLAGGAPITEYTPGSAPEWTDPQHQTSPWPPAAGSEPASSTEDQDSEGKNSDR